MSNVIGKMRLCAAIFTLLVLSVVAFIAALLQYKAKITANLDVQAYQRKQIMDNIEPRRQDIAP